MPARPVIAIAGLACETSTFSPARTDAAVFRPQRGDQVPSRYHFLHPDRPLGKAAAWRGTLIGHALPGGIVRREAFEALAGDMMERLRAVAADGELDGLWFDIHGAMCVEGLDDAEAELLGRIRAAVGTQVLVSASMDLQGNVSRELAHMYDLVTCYRTAPHEDELYTKERAYRKLIGLLGAPPPRQRPLKAWVPVPVLLAGEQTSTRLGPARHIYAAVAEVEAWPGVLDAAVWVGYAWADEPRNHAVVVVTGWHADAVSRGAQRLARLCWDARADFAFAAPTGSLAECLNAAIHAPAEKRPFFISDSGDNSTASGAGDVTWGLAKLLAAQPELDRPGSRLVVIYASLPESAPRSTTCTPLP